ncbi:hypothetical protein Tco_0452131 [Tanacetum coccineum]
MNDLEEEYQARSLLVKSKSTSAPSSPSGKNKGLIAETYDWDEEEVSFNDNEVTEVKALMALADEERDSVGKEIARNNNVSITDSNKHRLFEAENSTLSNLDTGKIPLVESQRNITDPSVAVTESSATNYDSADESLVCSTPFPPLKKLDYVEPISGPKTIKSILKSKSIFKTETLYGIIINKPSSAPARGNKSSSASKITSAPAGKLKNVKMEDDPPLAIVMKELNELKLQISKNKSFYFRNINTLQWFRKREVLQAKKAESFKASKTESSSALRSKTPTKRWVSKQN